MLTETRQEQILRLLREKGSVTVTELTEHFGASESTIRRDLNALHKKGALVKVFGGAVQTGEKLSTKEEKVSLRAEQNREEKIRIARHAAALVRPEDFVYLDAGTTTGYMIPFLTEKTAVFVTNAVSHALKLSENGFRVILIGGELKAATEAIVGNEAYADLQKYNFTKGFFGTNGAGIAGRLHHSGYQRGDDQAVRDGAVKRAVCALRQQQVCPHQPGQLRRVQRGCDHNGPAARRRI